MVWIAITWRQPDALQPAKRRVQGVQAARPDADPYGMEVDLDDNVWYASMYTDVMGKLDPKTAR